MLESRIIFTPVIADSIRHRNISTDTLSPEQPKFNIYIYISHIYPHVTSHATHTLS